MELVKVDVVGAQVGKRSVQVFPEVLSVLRRRLGGDVHLRADAVKGFAQLHLAVGVGAGGVEKADACLVGLAGQIDGVLLRDALDGQRAEAVFVHRDAGAAKGDHIHSCFLHSWVQNTLFFHYKTNLFAAQGISCRKPSQSQRSLRLLSQRASFSSGDGRHIISRFEPFS